MASRYDGDLVIQNGSGGGNEFFSLPFTAIGSNGGNGIVTTTNVTPRPIVGENRPTQQFDISVLTGLRPQDKYLGRNLVQDIQEAYQTYITGSAVGRGGQYAVDAARRYGTTLTEAARGYLVAVGLPTLANIISPTPVIPLPDDLVLRDEDFFGLPVPIGETIQQTQQITGNAVQILSDQLNKLFGNAVYNPPLQTQATGYTPVTTRQAIGGSNISLYVILAVVGIAGYFLYKRFAS